MAEMSVSTDRKTMSLSPIDKVLRVLEARWILVSTYCREGIK